jgi:hypothetical protein
MSEESRSSSQHYRVREMQTDENTVRMRAEDLSPHDTVPEQAGVYFAPRPVPALSKHRTIETARVRLSPEVDPKRARTQRLVLPQLPHRGRALGVAGLATVLVMGASVLVAHFVEPTSGAAITPPSVPATEVRTAISTPPAKDTARATFAAQKSAPKILTPIEPTPAAESPAALEASKPTAIAPKPARRASKDLWLE